MYYNGLKMAHYTDPDKRTRVISKPFKRGVPKLTKKVIIAAVALVAVGGLAWLTYSYVQKQNNKYSTACTDKSANGVLNKTVPYFQPNQYQELGKLVDQITTYPNFDKDPNCLAILMTYYINISDNVKAREYYDKLVVVYQPKKGYDKSIKAYAKTPEYYLSMVQFLEKQAEQSKKNTYYGPAVQ